MHYTWEKEDDLIPANVAFDNWNRTLTVISMQLENAGTYKCIVTDGVQSTSNSVSVEIAGNNYFIFYLRCRTMHLNDQLIKTYCSVLHFILHLILCKGRLSFVKNQRQFQYFLVHEYSMVH